MQKFGEVAIFKLPLLVRFLLQFRHLNKMADVVEGVPPHTFLGHFVDGFAIFGGDEVLLFSVFRNGLKF